MGAAEDAIVRIASYTGLTQKDVDELKQIAETNPEALPGLMTGYEEMGAVSDHGLWARIGEDLQSAAPYLTLAGAIIGIVTGVASFVKG